ncbi:response regulator containing a CheY-like receiver domain and an HTH DNA-binding domain [Leptolyngbyaceae cyanobacterium JSC-12]|nr:response regulator containing a CheY-like receiver domain and an HTH DNA-binding domain [Leptolyngbyaceae cyanobacterium JSC-12]
MTAPILTSSIDFLPIDSLFEYRPQPFTGTLAPRSAGKPSGANRSRDRLSANHPTELTDLSLIWSRLLELLPQGVIVVSRNLTPVYWNQKAKQLCRSLTDAEFSGSTLPLPVSEACHRIIREHSALDTALILECQTSSGHIVRVSARWLERATTHDLSSGGRVMSGDTANGTSAFIAVILENCEEVMRQEMAIQQKKYDLTDREAEIWMLLRQENTYQEIAQKLQISLNTVKTHVKNVYAKRRSCQGKEKFWC